MLDNAIYHGRFWSDTSEMFAFLHQLAGSDSVCTTPIGVDVPFVQWLKYHELAAYTYLRLGPPHALSPDLAPVYWANAGANTMKLALLESLLAAFAEAGIKCVLLKGIAYCLTLYPDTAVRPMSDLDLWIQRCDWPHVWQILHERGYETEKLWSKPEDIPDHMVALEFFPRQAMQEDFLSVEIHSDLIAHPTHLIGRFPLASWWKQTHTQTWQGHTIHVLDPAAALLHAAVHQMFQHRGQLRLRWLLDIDQLVRGTPNYHLTDTDWQRLTEKAVQAGVLPALQSALQLSQKWFDTPLPPPALALLNHPSPPPQQLFFQQMVVPQQSTAARVWTDIKGIDETHERITLLHQKLLPHSAYMMERYHISSRLLLPFYYIKRWAKAIQMIWQQQ
jgi:hypothetical protein